MSDASSTSPPSGGRHQRRLRNLLLDKHFQLKYTGYLVAIATVLSLSLGIILFRTSSQVVAQSEENAQQGQQIVELGKVVVNESRKVSAVVRMNIVKDPIYQDDPDLLDAFNTEAKEQDQRLADQRRKLEAQHAALVQQANDLQTYHRVMLLSLTGVLTLLVVLIGLAGIFVTHKVAGPIFKMKRHLRDVTKGKLEVPWGLRKGDELVEFFESFRKMVASLREEREGQIDRINRVLSDLDGQVDESRLRQLKDFKAELEKSLN